MSAIEWLVVIASGLGGFYLISKLIDALVHRKSRPAALQTQPIAVNASITAVPASTAMPTNKWNNYIARHWRGELSLPISYWINSFLGNIAIVLGIDAITNWADLKNNFLPEIALLTSILIWTTTIVICLWMWVGVWRSATIYHHNHVNSSWGGIAKFMIIIAMIRFLVSFVQMGIPQITEYYKIYTGDNEVGKYAFRVLRNGQELEFSGGITFGAAKEFEHFIDAMGSIKLVTLNSRGGRLSEAERIGNLIRQRNLNTYVSNRCLSACTIIFLSGRERLMAKNATLGFHQPDFPGMTDEDRRNTIAIEERRLQELGVSASFAHKANLAPPKSMWYPTTSELVSSGVVTKVIDPF